MDNSPYFQLCVRAIANEISAAEQERLDAWLEQSSENREYFNRLAETWEQQRSPELSLNVDIDRAWSRFERTLSDRREKASFSMFGNLSDFFADFLKSRFAPAMVSLAVLVVLSFSLALWKYGLFRSSYHTVVTQNKQTETLDLPDGTHVRLNSGSQIRYSNTFSGKQRRVTLMGEGFFIVAPGDGPFTVKTEQAITTVLGTQFNVWSRDGKTRVVVKEGRVMFASVKDDDNPVELTQGHMSAVVGRRPPEPPESVDSEHLLGWLKGQFVFKKSPLAEIVSELGRTYDVTIELAHPDMVSMTMTADFENAPIEEILSSICLTLHIRFTFESGRYVLTNEE